MILFNLLGIVLLVMLGLYLLGVLYTANGKTAGADLFFAAAGNLHRKLIWVLVAVLAIAAVVSWLS